MRPEDRRALLLLGLALAAPAQARADELSRRTVVRASTAVDMAVFERLEGQSNDLPVERVLVHTEETTLHDSAAHAELLLAEQRAAVVFWFAPLPGRYLVFASLPEQQPLLLARLERSDERAPHELSSSALEIAALVMRDALQALAAGVAVSAVEPTEDEIPETRAPHDFEAEPTSEAATEAAVLATGQTQIAANREAVAPPQSHSPRESERRPTTAAVAVEPRDPRTAGLNLFVGLQGLADGSGKLGRQGAGLRLGVELGAVELGLAGAVSLANRERDVLGELSIARHDARATLALRMGGQEHALWLGAGGGLALYARSTAATSEQLTSSAARITPALLLAPELGYAWMGQYVGLGVRAALDITPLPPRFVYEGEGAPDEAAYAPPVLAPMLALGLQARLM